MTYCIDHFRYPHIFISFGVACFGVIVPRVRVLSTFQRGLLGDSCSPGNSHKRLGSEAGRAEVEFIFAIFFPVCLSCGFQESPKLFVCIFVENIRHQFHSVIASIVRTAPSAPRLTGTLVLSEYLG